VPAVVVPVVVPAIVPVVVGVVVGVLVLAGCSPASAPPVEPAAGGVEPTTQPPPAAPMDDVERRVVGVLGARVRDDGLTLEHLSCPSWRGRLPAELSCSGWFDGVKGSVTVRLRAGPHGSVVYDARLTGGVVATHLVVERLRAEGFVDVDCGTLPAYPATAGTELVCLVTRDGEHGHVVATVADRDGSVTISEP
jgi:hypothetical protein